MTDTAPDRDATRSRARDAVPPLSLPEPDPIPEAPLETPKAPQASDRRTLLYFVLALAALVALWWLAEWVTGTRLMFPIG